MSTSPLHAPLPPSSAAIWLACPGQPRMVAAAPPLPQDDTASREGTTAHWAGAEMLHGRAVAEGQVTPEGTVLTQEMIDSAQVWVDTCLQRQAQATTRPVLGRTMWIEHRLPPALHADNWGTVDYAQYDPNAAVLDVVDFKHGHGIVEVFENWQLIDYAAMLCDHLSFRGNVRLTIVQPRAYHRDGPVRTWTTTAGALEQYWQRLILAAEDATGPDPQCRPNPGCTHCAARHVCPALQRDAYRSAQLSAEAIPYDLPPDALGLELSMLTEAAARLKARITGLEAQAEAMLRQSRGVPGWTMTPGQARLAWTRPVPEVLALGRMLGVDLAAPLDAITPTQAIAALKGATGEESAAAVIGAMAERPAAALKLTRADESLGRRVFGIA